MNYSSKSTVIYIVVLVLIIVGSSISAVAGWKGGHIQDSVNGLKKLGSTVQTFIKENLSTEEPPKANDSSKPFFDYTASAEAEVKVEPTSTPAPRRVVYPTAVPTRPEAYPTYAFPTIAPGEPGSKEWEDAFQKQWDEMTRHNEEMQRMVEENQRQFCEDHPDMCH